MKWSNAVDATKPIYDINDDDLKERLKPCDDITSCGVTGGPLSLNRNECACFRVPTQCQKYVS